MKFLLLFLLCFNFLFAAGDTSLVDINKVNPNIILDIRYATKNNFLKKKVYPEARCFLRKAAAEKLNLIQKELETIGLGLKIFDGYRPLSVQREMWKIMPDKRYVADPAKGSRHNRGAAVDLTLVDKNGNELEMPTPFDSFEKRAHHSYQNLSDKIKQNRWILRTIMEKYGFKPITSEWWHYDLIGWSKYSILDKSFTELEKNE